MESEPHPRAGLTRRQFIGLAGATGAVIASNGWLLTGDPAEAAPNPDGGTATKTFETFLRRRADQLSVKVEFWNLQLDTTGPEAMLEKKNANKVSYLVFQMGPQHLADRAFFKSSASDGASQPPGTPSDPTPPVVDEPPAPPPIDAVLAAGTRLAFVVPNAELPMPFTVEALLGWTRFNARVVPNAANRLVTEEQKGMNLRVPKPHETSIEYPWHLILSPHSGSTWAHSAQPVDHGTPRTELWHTRLAVKGTDGLGDPIADEANDDDRTVRAVWCRDNGFPGYKGKKNPPEALWDDLPFRMSLTARDRLDIVRLSADFNLANDFGKFQLPKRTTRGLEFVPRPVEVERLMLSSLGAWMDSSFSNELDFKDNDYNTSLLQWRHLGSMGRDSYVRVVRKGFLFEDGPAAALIKITERRFDHVDDDVLQPRGAYLRQRIFIVVTRPVRVFANDANMQNGGRRYPFRRIECMTRITPDLDLPAQFAPPHSANAVFVPHLGGEPFLFQIRATDWEGNTHVFGKPYVWVDDTKAYNAADVQPIIDAYMAAGPVGATQFVPLNNARVTFAPSAKPGDTASPTDSIAFGAELPHAPYTADQMARQGKPGFYPAMFQARLNMPELAAAAGNGIDPPTLEYFENYVSGSDTPGTDGAGGGFFPANPNNKGDVFFSKPVSAGASMLGVGARSGGGVITPSLPIQGLSRQLGPTGDPEDTKAGTFTPTSFLDQGAKLMGGVLLVEVIEAVADILTDDGKSKALKITSTREENPNRVETKIDWTPKLQAAPPGFNLIVPVADGNDAGCVIKAEIVTNLDDPPASTYKIDGKITNVTVCLFGADNADGDPGATTFVKVPVQELSFKAGSEVKEDLDCDLGEISFHGPLDFVAKLAEAMSFGGGSGIKIDVTDGGVAILLSIAIPDITLGVMSLTNMKIEVGLNIPFDGSPISFRFAFCSREAPFTLTVWVFGGGGFVGLVIGVDGVELLEFSFEFGGGWAIDIGVASGKIEAKAGIYFKLETVEENGKNIQRVHLEAYFRLHGSVEVLGIISVSLTLTLSLIYESPPSVLAGEASMVVEVEVLFFSGSVEIKVRKVLHSEEDENLAAAFGMSKPAASAAAEPAALPGPTISFADLITQPQYDQYCAAFAQTRS